MGKKDEYDANFWAEAEKLDVRCRLLNDYVGEAIQKYQLKAFAMLLSSFSEVLFLDADNFPVVPIDDIFSTSMRARKTIISRAGNFLESNHFQKTLTGMQSIPENSHSHWTPHFIGFYWGPIKLIRIGKGEML
jgi:Mannosyltransferase putative